MLTCVRWYAAYPLSLRHIEEMMAERGVCVDHATVHRWAMKILPVLAAVFRRSKRPELAYGRKCVTNTGASLWCCAEDGSRPPEAGLQEQASNRPVLRKRAAVALLNATYCMKTIV